MELSLKMDKIYSLLRLFYRFVKQLLLIDFIRFMICFPRYLYFRFVRVKYRTLEDIEKGSENIAQDKNRSTLSHNLKVFAFSYKAFKDLLSSFSVQRSSRLIRPLMGIDRLTKNSGNTKVLIIGPRTEGEIFNLMGYGFKLKNIKALDLHTYSPRVDLGDIHDMPYANDTFDLVICGWVIPYSNNKTLAASEIKRVLKNNGIVAIGLTYQPSGMHFGTGLVDSTESIHNLFSSDVKNVYFRYDQKEEDKESIGGIITAFSCNKPISKTESKGKKSLVR